MSRASSYVAAAAREVSVLKIAIVGPGQIGLALAGKWSARGHHIFFTFSRSEEKLRRLASELGDLGSWGTPAEAVAACEVLLLAARWQQVPQAISLMGEVEGKLLIETVNPIGEDGELEIGHTTSAGEEIAKLAPGATVVAAFNSLPATVIAGGPELYGGKRPVVFYCGGDNQTKPIVKGLIEDAGFEAADAGPIQSCRYIEPLSLLMIRAASRLKIRDISLGLLKPER